MNQAITDTAPLDENPLPTVSNEAQFELGPTIRASAELDSPEPEPAGLVAVEVDRLAAGQQHGRLMAKMFGLETEPERLRHYVLLEELGRGGMGVVYAAYDHKLDRKVAIKLIQARRDEAAQQRLMREAKAMAQLSHPNVVQVHEITNTEDMTFIVMEYISGQTLREWLADDDVPRIRASILSTFIRAGRGLAAAHEAGLVHRDFKPDNVMLGDDGRVRVLDFGLARADGPGVGEGASTSDEAKGTSPAALDGHLTRTGAVLGTPAYMPLEQLRGRPADTRSDQFSFCVALYEALYGERPFAGRALSDLMDSVSGGEVLPAAKNSTVPGWLREVVVRGLRPEPAERWPSMAELLTALADDPSVRRRKRWLAAGMVGLLAGGAWGVATAVEHDAQICKGMEAKLEGVWDDARRAEVEAAFERTGLGFSATTWERVQPWLDDYTSAWVVAREQACEATQRGEQSDKLLDRRMACLDERLVHVKAMVDVLAQADETVLEKAVEAVSSLPRLERCADVEALMADVPPPEDPEVAARVEALGERLADAAALDQTGKFADGLVVASAVVVEAEELGYEPLKVRAWLTKGHLQGMGDEPGAAEATLKQSYELAVGLRMPAEAAESSSALASVVGNKLGRPEDGRRWLEHARPQARAARTDEARGDYLNSLGLLANSEGKYEEARGHFERELAIQEKALGLDHPNVANAHNSLGVVANSEGKYEEARGHYERALAIQEKALGLDHPGVAMSFNNLGGVADREGKYEEARDHYERGMAIEEKALGLDHPLVAVFHNNLGALAISEGKYEEARGHFERALAIEEKALGPDHPELAFPSNNLGIVAYRKGKYEDARDHWERALAIREKALGPDHPSLVSTINNLGAVANSEGKYEEARGHFERVLAIGKKALGPDHPALANIYVNLGVAAAEEGKYEEAREHTERALAINEKALGPDHSLVALSYVNLGQLALSAAEYEEARAHCERALAIREKALGPDHPHLADALTALGRALLGLDQASEGLPHLERALAICTTNDVDPVLFADTRFALARALWETPAKQGRDRDRARTLAELARAAYTDADSTEDLEMVESWLRRRAR